MTPREEALLRHAVRQACDNRTTLLPAVALAINLHTDEQLAACPSAAELAARAGSPAPTAYTVKRWLGWLADVGAIRLERRRGLTPRIHPDREALAVIIDEGQRVRARRLALVGR